MSSGQASSLPSSIGVPKVNPLPTFSSLGTPPMMNAFTGQQMGEHEDAQKLNQIQSQVANLSTRLGHGGFKNQVERIEDSRNWLEKAFNLPEKQNWLFDVFEVIRRPQQAIFSVLEDMFDPKLRGKNVPLVASFIEGLKGEREAYGGQILRNIFHDGKEEDGTFDWTDVVGFMGDIFLDPADIMMIPLTGGLSYLKKVPKTAFRAVDDVVAHGVKIMNTMDNIEDGLRIARATASAGNSIRFAKEVVQKTSVTGFVWKNIGFGLKNGTKKSADFLEIGLRHLDPNMGTAFNAFRKATIDKFTRAGTTIQRKTSEYFWKKSEVFQRHDLTNEKFIADIDGVVNKIIPEEKLTKINSMFDTSSHSALAQSTIKNGKAIDDLLGVPGISNQIRDAILNKGQADDVMQVIKNQVGLRYRQDIMNVYEFMKLDRSPKSLDEFINIMANDPNKQMQWTSTAEETMRKWLGDDLFSKHVEIMNVDQLTIMKLDDNFFNFKNIKRLQELKTENMVINDGLARLDTAFSDFDNVIKLSKASDFEPLTNVPTFNQHGIPLHRAVSRESNIGMNTLINKSKKTTDARKFLKKNEQLLKDFLGSDYDNFADNIRKLSPNKTIYGELVETISTRHSHTPLGKHLSRAVNQMGAGTEINTFLSAGLPQVQRKAQRALNSYLRRANIELNAEQAKALFGDSKSRVVKFRDLLSEPDKVLFDSMSKEGTSNLSNVYKYFIEKNPALESLIGDDLYSKIYQRQIVDILGNRTINPQVGDFVTNKISLGNFYTPEDLERLGRLSKDENILEGVNILEKAIFDAQGTMGEWLLGDADALRKASIKGYVPHVTVNEIQARLEGLTPEQAQKKYATIMDEIKKGSKHSDFDTGFFSMGRTATFKDRKYAVSALEANTLRTAYYRESVTKSDWFLNEIPEELQKSVHEYFTKDMFSTDIKTTFGELLTRKTEDLAHNARNTDILTSLAFGNPYAESSYFRIMDSTEQVGRNFKRLTPNEARNVYNMVNTVEKLGGDTSYTKELLKALKPTLKENATKGVFMEEHLYRLAMNTRKAPNEVAQFIGHVNNIFKAGKVASPAFNIRNMVGNWYNMWVSGIPAHKIPTYWAESFGMQSKFPEINQRVLREGVDSLSSKEREIYDIVSNFKKNGFFERSNIVRLNDVAEMDKMIQGQSQSRLAKTLTPINKMMDANLRMNILVDNTSRMSLYRYALDNPEYLQKLGLDEGATGAMNAVRLALFDPNDLSFFEQDVMKKLIPFYTWSRQNLAFQTKNLMENSSKYYKTYKTFESLWAGSDIDTADLQEYERDQLYVPVPWMTKDGNYTALKLSLPLADLIEFSTPGEAFRRFMSSTTPLIRAPFEATTGNVTFTGQPIERYEGEMSRNIPWMSKKFEWGVSQTGADVPLKVLTGAGRVVVSAVKGTNADPSEVQKFFEDESFVEGMTNALNITARPRNVATNQLYQQYEKLDRLNALLRKQQDAGNTIPTLDDIAKGSSSLPKIRKQTDQLKEIQELVNRFKKP